VNYATLRAVVAFTLRYTSIHSSHVMRSSHVLLFSDNAMQ